MKITETTFIKDKSVEEFQALGGVNGLMSDIVDYARNRIVEAMSKEEAKINCLHPITLITLMVTNLTINLALACIVSNNTKERLEMVNELSSGIKKMIDEAWSIMETAGAEGEKH